MRTFSSNAKFNKAKEVFTSASMPRIQTFSSKKDLSFTSAALVPETYDWMSLVLIIIIALAVILVVVGTFLALRNRKGTDVATPGTEMADKSKTDPTDRAMVEQQQAVVPVSVTANAIDEKALEEINDAVD